MPKELTAQFKLLMSKHVQSVNLISILTGYTFRSCTISSLVSISASELENPVLAFSLKKGSEMEGLLSVGSSVWINLLNSDQAVIAQHYSKKRVGKDDPVLRIDERVDLVGSIGQFEVDIISTIEISESVFFFGKVSNVDLSNISLQPLTYYSRRYNGLNTF